MSEGAVTDALLRQFLLGKVTDEQRQRLESLFLIDEDMKERILAVEEELIDDYLEDTLTTKDREQFLLHYGQTPEQQRKLRIAQSIKEWAESAQPVHVEVPANSSRTRWRLKPALVIPIALAAVVLIVAALWLWSVNVQRNRRLAIEQELAQLNSPSSLRDVSSQILSLELSPVAVRSGEQQDEINPRADIRLIELRLPWVQKERYSTYQAEIGRVGDDESFTIHNLQAESHGGFSIRLRLPAHILRRGHYQVRLTGINPDGSTGPTEEYTFAVGQ